MSPDPTGRTSRPLDDAMIGAIVDDFYGKARIDPLLGPIFTRIIPDDKWRAHLDVIADFWSSMLLGTRSYDGRPMPKHLALDDLEDVHFERWLALFRETVEIICPPEIAALFVDRSERIAQSFRLGLAYHRGEDTLAVTPMRAGLPPQRGRSSGSSSS